MRNLSSDQLEELIAVQVKKLYELGVVDASFIGLDPTPVCANTRQNNPKSFVKNKSSKENHPKSHQDCALGVHSASNQHDERRYEFYWGYKSHVLVDCISGLPLYELTTPANVMGSTVASAANRVPTFSGKSPVPMKITFRPGVAATIVIKSQMFPIRPNVAAKSVLR